MLKMSYAGFPSPSPAISAQFTFKCVPQLKITKKFNKTPLWGVQSYSRSSTLTSIKKLVTSACYDKQHVCTYMYLQLFSRYTR